MDSGDVNVSTCRIERGDVIKDTNNVFKDGYRDRFKARSQRIQTRREQEDNTQRRKEGTDGDRQALVVPSGSVERALSVSSAMTHRR